MKKISTLLLSALTFLFVGCAEATQEWHDTHFEPQMPNGMLFYADQEYGNLKVFSFDPWTVETVGDSAWFTISPTGSHARPGQDSLATTLSIRMPQNTTGLNRMNAIVVKSYFDLSMPIFQRTWLNITRPTPAIDKSKHFIYQTVRFAFNLQSYATTEYVNFYVYQDDAKLTWEGDHKWVNFTDDNAGKNELTFKKGSHTVKLNINKNEEAKEHEAKLLLTSGKITTPIYFKQAPKEEK